MNNPSKNEKKQQKNIHNCRKPSYIHLKSSSNKATKELNKLAEETKNQGIENILESLTSSAKCDYLLWKIN